MKFSEDYSLGTLKYTVVYVEIANDDVIAVHTPAVQMEYTGTAGKSQARRGARLVSGAPLLNTPYATTPLPFSTVGE